MNLLLSLASSDDILPKAADTIWNFFANEKINEILVKLALDIISVIVILVILSVVRRVGKNFIKKAFAVNIDKLQKMTGGTERRKGTLESLVLNIWRYTVNIVGIFAVLGVFFDVRTLLISTGGFAVVVAFAAKSMLDDIAMGFFIVFEDLFSIGDFIELDGVTGTVTEIGLRSVKIRVLTGETVIIPNGNIQKVINHSISNGQAIVDVSVAYEADLEKAIDTLEQIAKDAFDKYDDILTVPVVLGVQELGASEVVVRMTAEVKPLQQWRIQRELRKIIKLTFDQEGIEIPFPRMVVYQKDGGSTINE